MSYYYYGNENRRGGFLSQLPPVTKNLVIINVIIFVATLINENFMIGTFALFYPTSPYFHWWQVVTHMFMHGGFWHIFFNMYTLFIFGCVVERIIGSKKFLLFYFICGLGAVALHFGVRPIWKAPPWATPPPSRTSPRSREPRPWAPPAPSTAC